MNKTGRERLSTYPAIKDQSKSNRNMVATPLVLAVKPDVGKLIHEKSQPLKYRSSDKKQIDKNFNSNNEKNKQKSTNRSSVVQSKHEEKSKFEAKENKVPHKINYRNKQRIPNGINHYNANDTVHALAANASAAAAAAARRKRPESDSMLMNRFSNPTNSTNITSLPDAIDNAKSSPVSFRKSSFKSPSKNKKLVDAFMEKDTSGFNKKHKKEKSSGILSNFMHKRHKHNKTGIKDNENSQAAPSYLRRRSQSFILTSHQQPNFSRLKVIV